MKTLFSLLILVFYSVVSLAQAFDISTLQEKPAQKFNISLIKDSSNKPSKLLIKANDEAKLEVPLGIQKINNTDMLVLQNSDDKNKVLTTLGCDEYEFNHTFTPIYSGIITMLDTLSKGDESSIEINIKPQESDSSMSLWMGLLIPLFGIIGYIVGKFFRAKTTPKVKEETLLHIDDTVMNNKGKSSEPDVWSQYLVDLFAITKTDVKTNGGLKEAVSAKLKTLIDEKNMLKSEKEKWQKSNAEDSTYFKNLETKYINTINDYFLENKFSSTLEPRQKLIDNLLPLAFHFQSYIKLKTNKAMDADKVNYQTILTNKPMDQSHKVPFVSNFAENTPYIASIVGILENYELTALKDVNVLNNTIAK